MTRYAKVGFLYRVFAPHSLLTILASELKIKFCETKIKRDGVPLQGIRGAGAVEDDHVIDVEVWPSLR